MIAAKFLLPILAASAVVVDSKDFNNQQANGQSYDWLDFLPCDSDSMDICPDGQFCNAESLSCWLCTDACVEGLSHNELEQCRLFCPEEYRALFTTKQTTIEVNEITTEHPRSSTQDMPKPPQAVMTMDKDLQLVMVISISIFAILATIVLVILAMIKLWKVYKNKIAKRPNRQNSQGANGEPPDEQQRLNTDESQV